MVVLLLALQVTLLGASSAIIARAETGSAAIWEIAPIYLSALGTVAAFAVTALLFRRGTEDRAREQASKVYVFSKRDETTGEIVATVHNRSDLPIWRVETYPLQNGEVITENLFPDRPDLEPEGSTQVRWKPSMEGESIERDWRLRFLDASGQEWVRIGNRLKRQRKQRFRRS